jgi:hypothetical protein
MDKEVDVSIAVVDRDPRSATGVFKAQLQEIRLAVLSAEPFWEIRKKHASQLGELELLGQMACCGLPSRIRRSVFEAIMD